MADACFTSHKKVHLFFYQVGGQRTRTVASHVINWLYKTVLYFDDLTDEALVQHIGICEF